jgi:hypothetical protein
VEAAKAVCETCPVTVECSEAGRREKFGTWGGLSTRGRKLARKAAA